MIIIFAALLAGPGVAWLQTAAPESSYPLEFERDFAGTGLVEQITPLAEGCEVQIALYAWLSLSQGFSLAEIPAQNDRYNVRGTADHCTALTIAMAGASAHIAFEIGNAGNNWYFLNRPLAGTGCGGLAIDWKPDPL